MPTIITKIEGKRGCGYRKPGGMYFVSSGAAASCHKLPIPLTVCPCCNAGIKQSRGFTWINSSLFAAAECGQKENCMGNACAANLMNVRMGLMWVGEKFYPTVEHFTKESNRQGISKRFAQLPTDYVVGETWIVLAHPKACVAIGEKGIEHSPGVFSMFRPERIEYVVAGTESPDKLESLEKRGFW